MGQKVHPYGIRLGICKEWKSNWFFAREYRQFLIEDLRVRRAVQDYCRQNAISGVAEVRIRRKMADRIEVTITTAKPGLLIGRQGKGIEALRHQLEELTGKQCHVAVEEVKDARLDATLVAETIAAQIERRQSMRRVVKKAISDTMRAGAQGIQVTVSGRVGGAEIARSETQKEGKIPRSTLRADVNYGFAEARTPYGYIGVKVWICLDDGKQAAASRPSVAQELFAGVSPDANA